MPLYICVAPRGSIPAAGKQEISRSITRIHCEVTNAPPTFVHALFFDREQVSSLGPLWKDVSPDCPYQILGGIRAGRTEEQKERLDSGIRGSVAEVLGVGIEKVAVATADSESRWTMEGGHMIPEPGEEEAWPMPDWMRKT
jgi:phenylpyruvate tautomerase PptA (4-oxalocrotonate tautomerase family)